MAGGRGVSFSTAKKSAYNKQPLLEFGLFSKPFLINFDPRKYMFMNVDGVKKFLGVLME